jgi:hypothetical protein
MALAGAIILLALREIENAGNYGCEEIFVILTCFFITPFLGVSYYDLTRAI